MLVSRVECGAMRRWCLILGTCTALAVSAVGSTASLAADRLQFGTAWTAASRGVAGLPAVDPEADANGRVVFYTPRQATPQLHHPEVDPAAGGTGYLRSFGPVGLSLFSEFADRNARPGETGAGTWSSGLKLTYEGFGLGGSLARQTDGAGALETSRDAYELAGSYSTGRLTIGLAYQRIVEEPGYVAGGAGFDTDPGNYYSLGVSYELFPGLTLGGGLQLHAAPAQPAGAGISEGPRTILMLGTAIEF